ncbi:hypothetical protein [Candidatus Poriferisocius sp.]|uniref:hypothetical protein n=1 Tax=Candidatus Poriferisocius sp. TaxID=3101276 RepID=UPI003B025487
MSDQPARRAPPGWYAEQGRGGYRYWDGQAWASGAGEPIGLPVGSSGNRSSPSRQRVGLALLGAGVALVVAGLLLPWAETGSARQGVLDGEIPWLVGPGGVADSWLLLPMAAVMLWAVLVVSLTGNNRRVWLVMLVAGLAVMGFCVSEGLAMDEGLDTAGSRVGSGLFVAYAGGAAASLSGVLLRPRLL